jgi:hypothetical protein
MTRSLISQLLISTRRNRKRLCGLMGMLLLASPLIHAQDDNGYDPPNCDAGQRLPPPVILLPERDQPVPPG